MEFYTIKTSPPTKCNLQSDVVPLLVEQLPPCLQGSAWFFVQKSYGKVKKGFALETEAVLNMKIIAGGHMNMHNLGRLEANTKV